MSALHTVDLTNSSVIDDSQTGEGVYQHETNDDDPGAQLSPEYQESIEFLKQIHPHRRWVLTAIHPGTPKTVTATFDQDRQEACEKWLRKYATEHNLYFHVNPSSFDVTKKLQREEIDEVVLLHVDIDPRAGVPLADARRAG